MNRRGFIISVMAIGGGLGLGLYIISRRSLWGEPALVFQLSKFLTSGVNAQLIGRSYLAQSPEEHDPDGLAISVFPLLESAKEPPDRKWVVEQFLDQVRRDFEEDQVINLEGWMLSRTEAQLCALATFA